MHATKLCIEDAEQEQQLIESLSQELKGHKLLLSAKTVRKNIDLLKEEERKVNHLSDELTTLRSGTKTVDARKAMQSKEKEFKDKMTELKLAQDRLRKSVDGLTKSRLQVLSSTAMKGDKKGKRKAENESDLEEVEFGAQLSIDEDEEALLAQEIETNTW